MVTARAVVGTIGARTPLIDVLGTADRAGTARLRARMRAGMYTRHFAPGGSGTEIRRSVRATKRDAHGPPGDEIRRHLGRGYRAHPQRARHVKREVDAGHEVAVVVSAMAGATNRLVEWCRDAALLHDAREYDAVVASGEQVTAGLLAIALKAIGVNARSWQGWQLPILTSDAHGSARILEVNGDELIKRFKERKRGRGHRRLPGPAQGDRTHHHARPRRLRHSAVAIAAAIHADRCDIYTDVDGVYTTDPRVVPKARRLDKIAYEEMLELASLGAKVLQVRSVELGMVHNVPIFVRSSFEQAGGHRSARPPPGTLICDEEDIMEQQVVTGIAFSKDEAQISIRRVQDKPGVAAASSVRWPTPTSMST